MIIYTKILDTVKTSVILITQFNFVRNTVAKRQFNLYEAQRYKDQGLTNKQVAEIIGCSVDWCKHNLTNTIKPKKFFTDNIAVYDFTNIASVDKVLKIIDESLYPEKLLEILEEYLWNKRFRDSYKYLLIKLYMKDKLSP